MQITDNTSGRYLCCQFREFFFFSWLYFVYLQVFLFAVRWSVRTTVVKLQPQLRNASLKKYQIWYFYVWSIDIVPLEEYGFHLFLKYIVYWNRSLHVNRSSNIPASGVLGWCSWSTGSPAAVSLANTSLNPCSFKVLVRSSSSLDWESLSKMVVSTLNSHFSHTTGSTISSGTLGLTRTTALWDLL